MPEGKRCAACFSFDFDALSLWIGSFKITTQSDLSRGEFGAVGARRILDLLDKYSLKSTWFVPGHTVETYPDLVKEIFDKGHEIGHHNYLHESPLELKTKQQEKSVMQRASRCIEQLTGKKPEGYRAPAWLLSRNTTSLLRELGFTYDSSMMAHDYLPYRVREGDVVSTKTKYKFGRDSNLIELPVSWELDDFPYFEHLLSSPGSGLRTGSHVLENWIVDFDYMYDHVPGGIFNVAFHPQVTGRGHRMVVLEKLISHVLDKGDVWLPRMIDVAKACDLAPAAK